MLSKYGKQTHGFWGIFIFSLSVIFYILGAFLIKQLFHSCLLDMRLAVANEAEKKFTISYPMHAHGIKIIVNY